MKRKSQKYQTSTGKTVELVPVAYYKIQLIVEKLEKEMRAAGEPLDPPTYTVTVGDHEQVHEHYKELDPETGELKTSLETDAELAAWEAYLAANQRLQAAATFPTLRFCLRNGVIVDMAADDTDWEVEQQFDGIEIPADPREKYFHYILTEVIPTPAEQKEVSEIIMIASMSGDAETEQAVKKLFRGSLAETSK